MVDEPLKQFQDLDRHLPHIAAMLGIVEPGLEMLVSPFVDRLFVLVVQRVDRFKPLDLKRQLLVLVEVAVVLPLWHIPKPRDAQFHNR